MISTLQGYLCSEIFKCFTFWDLLISSPMWLEGRHKRYIVFLKSQYHKHVAPGSTQTFKYSLTNQACVSVSALTNAVVSTRGGSIPLFSRWISVMSSLRSLLAFYVKCLDMLASCGCQLCPYSVEIVSSLHLEDCDHFLSNELYFLVLRLLEKSFEL